MKPAAITAAICFTASIVCAACGASPSGEQPQQQESQRPANVSEAERQPSNETSTDKEVDLTPPKDWDYSVWLSSGNPLQMPELGADTPMKEEFEASLQSPVVADGAQVDQRFIHDLWAIAKLYKSHARVDDEAAWAPFLCRMPMPGDGRISMADGDDDHARKLYYLYARDRSNYLQYGGDNSESFSVSAYQSVVKEAFVPRKLEGEEADTVKRWAEHGYLKPEDRKALKQAYGEGHPMLPPQVNAEGEPFIPGDAAGLFVLFRPEHDADATDEGWVYGTLSAEGEITACGVIESCKTCHEEAQQERLFGLQ